MTDDAKDWVSIRIPEAVRDDAREREPTYGELLTFGVEAYDADLVGSNDDGDVWLNVGESEDLPEPTDERGLGDILAEEVDVPGVEIDAEQLARIEAAVETIEERTGKIERQLEGLQG